LSILFQHALDLAWSDGRLSKRGAILLENFQEILELSDSQRSVVEEKHHLQVVPHLIPRGFGSGASTLDQWMTSLMDLDDELPRYLISMGRQSLETGISKQAWIEGFVAAERMNCEFEFARGVWEPEFEVEILLWPEALDPVAKSLGLLLEEE
tara:strand:- start:92 stop:550 length:459 start_codon:yes stop_codon:yes gene_type:complete